MNGVGTRFAVIATLARLLMGMGPAGCSTTEVIGYKEVSGEGEISDTSGGIEADTDNEISSLFPRIFLQLDFGEDDDNVNWYDESEWRWNSNEGTIDLDVEFTMTPEWRTLEYYISEDIWPGGLDWRGAAIAQYRVRVSRAGAGFLRAFMQSIEQESEDLETWLWYTQDYEMTEGEWVTLTLDLRNADPAQLNLEESTKLGFQVHAAAVDAPEGDTDTQWPLAEPSRIVLQIDEITVRGI